MSLPANSSALTAQFQKGLVSPRLYDALNAGDPLDQIVDLNDLFEAFMQEDERMSRAAEDMVTKPETGEKYHHVPIRSADLFVKGSFITFDISKEQGIKAVAGKLKKDPGGKLVIQKYLFDKEKWSLQDAIKWAEEHKKFTSSELAEIKEVLESVVSQYENKIDAVVEARIDAARGLMRFPE